MLDNNGKKYLGEIFHYVGIGFIGGSISHGFFSGQRSLIMAFIGFILFIIGELLQKQNFKDVNYLKLSFVGVFYSLSIGMVNGGLQHFLDSPERSLWIIPLGFFLSLLIFPLKENTSFKELKKNLLFLSAFSIFISFSVILAYFLIPKDFYQQFGSHHEEVNINNQNQENTHNSMMKQENIGNDEMKEHCAMMPEMAGCEKYNNLNNNHNDNLNNIDNHH